MSVDIIERMRTAFRAEALELLTEFDAALLALEADPGDRRFRASGFPGDPHRSKGPGQRPDSRIWRRLPTESKRPSNSPAPGSLAITGDLVDCGLKACDVLRSILGAADPDAECPGEQAVTEALAALLPRQGAKPSSPIGAAAPNNLQGTERTAFEVMFARIGSCSTPAPTPSRCSMNCAGSVRPTSPATCDGVPLFFDLEPESCYLWWEVMLVTDRGEAAIREVFSFVEDEMRRVHTFARRSVFGRRAAGDHSSRIPGAVRHRVPGASWRRLRARRLTSKADNSSRESLDALFRAVHSIKGNAGLLLGQVRPISCQRAIRCRCSARMAHALESALDRSPSERRRPGRIRHGGAGVWNRGMRCRACSRVWPGSRTASSCRRTCSNSLGLQDRSSAGFAIIRRLFSIPEYGDPVPRAFRELPCTVRGRGSRAVDLQDLSARAENSCLGSGLSEAIRSGRAGCGTVTHPRCRDASRQPGHSGRQNAPTGFFSRDPVENRGTPGNEAGQ